MNTKLGRLILRTCIAIIVIGLLNFAVFVAITLYLGGDAVNGKIEGGRYYLWGVRGDGQKGYTEVKKTIFEYSRLHVYSVLISWPFVIGAGFLANRLQKSSKGILTAHRI